eukprot:scaffold865_cov65-Phaeocystis_antarctica.AAC.5
MPNHKTAFIEYRAVSTPLQGKAHAVPNMKNAHTSEEERRRVCSGMRRSSRTSTTCKYGSCSPMPMHALPTIHAVALLGRASGKMKPKTPSAAKTRTAVRRRRLWKAGEES